MKVCIYCGGEYSNVISSCEGCGSREFKNKCDNCGEIFGSGRCPYCGPRGAQGSIMEECKTMQGVMDTPVTLNKSAKEPQFYNSKKKMKKKDRITVFFGIIIYVGMLAVVVIILQPSISFTQTARIVYEGEKSGREDIWKNYPDTSAGSWVQTESGWWYKNEDGSYTKDDFQCINGEIYRFNESGYMMTGWQKMGNKFIFLKHDGIMARDMWVTDEDGSEYYLQADGILAVDGYVKSENRELYYKVDKNGARDQAGDQVDLEK